MRESEGELSDETRMQFEKGWLWEEALSLAFGQKAAARPEPLYVDGIWGSPDGIRYDDPAKLIPIVEEYKCTAVRSDKSPADMWRWMMQVKGYCKMVGAFKCVFRILHLEFVPVYKVWEIEFTQRELDENWEAIMNQAKFMRRGE